MSKLKQAIKDSGINQIAICKSTGLARSYLSRLVTGKITPTVPTAYKIAQALGLSKELPLPLLDLLLSKLHRVLPTKQDTLVSIDYGLEQLLRSEDAEKGLLFIETFLLANSETLTLQVFDSVIRELSKNNNNILNRLMTRWFLKGDRVHCEAITEIVKETQSNILLAVDSNEMYCSEFNHIFFLAKKAVGYSFKSDRLLENKT